MNLSSIILDISVIGILLIMFMWAKNKGFIRSVIDLVSVAASALLAYAFSGKVAEMLFNVFAKEKIITTIADAIEKNGVVADNLSKAISSALSMFGGPDVSATVNQVITANGTQDVNTLARALTEGAVTPVVTPLISGIAFVLLFIVCSVVLKIIAKLIHAISKNILINAMVICVVRLKSE